MKKAAAFLLSAAIALSLLAACGGDAGTAAVKSVREIAADGSIAFADRYAGIVVSGESAEIKKDEDKEILEVRVAEGDMVSKGDVLFSYDTEAMQLRLEKLKLEYEMLQNKKLSAETDIPVIQNKLRWASAADQLAYNLQIQSLEADILESTYNMSIKEREIAALETAMQNADVQAPITGRIMSVKESGNDAAGAEGSAENAGNAFITITDITTYRIKGTINEMNVGTLTEGMPVIIRSRVDSGRTWSGTLAMIDWETTVNSANNRYGFSDEMTGTTKYPFYVDIADFDGLLLGQHVYIEPDYGQKSAGGELRLPAYYIVTDQGDPFVWAQNGRGKLEKRPVSLGEEDPEDGSVQIVSGLSLSDSIAFPEESLRAGMTCVPYEDTMFVDEGAGQQIPEETGAAVPDDAALPPEAEITFPVDDALSGETDGEGMG